MATAISMAGNKKGNGNGNNNGGNGDGNNGNRQAMVTATTRMMAAAMRVMCNKEGKGRKGGKGEGYSDKGGK
jgi:hypothetical protein